MSRSLAIVRLARHYEEVGHDEIWALVLAERQIADLERLGLVVTARPDILTEDDMFRIMRREYRRVPSERELVSR